MADDRRLSTLEDVPTSSGRRAVLGRRAFLVLLAASSWPAPPGCSACTGVRRRPGPTATTCSVTYAAVARAGLDVPLEVMVRHPGGFAEELVLGITADYLDIFETQGFTPDPTEATRDGDTLYLTFAGPARRHLRVLLRRLHPAVEPAGPRRRRSPSSTADAPVVSVPVDIDLPGALRRRRHGDRACGPSWCSRSCGCVTRAVGRATLGELSTFELLLYVTMGDLVQQGVTQQDYSLTGAALAVGTFALLTVALSWLQWRFPRTRPAVTGRPLLVVRDGAPVEARCDPAPRARRPPRRRPRAGHPTDPDVEYAVLEADGRISFFTVDERAVRRAGASRPRADAVRGWQGGRMAEPSARTRFGVAVVAALVLPLAVFRLVADLLTDGAATDRVGRFVAVAAGVAVFWWCVVLARRAARDGGGRVTADRRRVTPAVVRRGPAT